MLDIFGLHLYLSGDLASAQADFAFLQGFNPVWVKDLLKQSVWKPLLWQTIKQNPVSASVQHKLSKVTSIMSFYPLCLDSKVAAAVHCNDFTSALRNKLISWLYCEWSNKNMADFRNTLRTQILRVLDDGGGAGLCDCFVITQSQESRF